MEWIISFTTIYQGHLSYTSIHGGIINPIIRIIDPILYYFLPNPLLSTVPIHLQSYTYTSRYQLIFLSYPLLPNHQHKIFYFKINFKRTLKQKKINLGRGDRIIYRRLIGVLSYHPYFLSRISTYGF